MRPFRTAQSGNHQLRTGVRSTQDAEAGHQFCYAGESDPRARSEARGPTITKQPLYPE